MTARTNVRLLALMSRVARVREIQARQALVQAVGMKEAQQERADEMQGRGDRSDVALQSALQGPVVDLALLPLLMDLSVYIQGALEDERTQLSRCEQDVRVHADAASQRVRQRERLGETANAAMATQRKVRELRQLEHATEAWLIRREREGA